jgi:hypothetical protein
MVVSRSKLNSQTVCALTVALPSPDAVESRCVALDAMFSTGFECVIATAAGTAALQAFPARSDLPVSATTLCCLGFADFLLQNCFVGRDDEAWAGTAVPPLRPDDLDKVMRGAAKVAQQLVKAFQVDC